MANAPAKRMENQTLENVEIMWRNFEGKEGQFNAAGDRNFCIRLQPAMADRLAEAGWTVKSLPPREEGDTETLFIKVKVKYSEKARPPRVVMITSKGRTSLTEDMLMLLDWADIAKVDCIVRPYQWDIRGQSGVAAYLQTIFVTIREDELELKYADVPELESAQKSVTADATPGDEFDTIEGSFLEDQHALGQAPGF